jgi:hypothetical protein
MTNAERDRLIAERDEARLNAEYLDVQRTKLQEKFDEGVKQLRAALDRELSAIKDAQRAEDELVNLRQAHARLLREHNKIFQAGQAHMRERVADVLRGDSPDAAALVEKLPLYGRVPDDQRVSEALDEAMRVTKPLRDKMLEAELVTSDILNMRLDAIKERDDLTRSGELGVVTDTATRSDRPISIAESVTLLKDAINRANTSDGPHPFLDTLLLRDAQRILGAWADAGLVDGPRGYVTPLPEPPR